MHANIIQKNNLTHTK